MSEAEVIAMGKEAAGLVGSDAPLAENALLRLVTSRHEEMPVWDNTTMTLFTAAYRVELVRLRRVAPPEGDK